MQRFDEKVIHSLIKVMELDAGLIIDITNLSDFINNKQDNETFSKRKMFNCIILLLFHNVKTVIKQQ